VTLSGFQLDGIDAELVSLDASYIIGGQTLTVQEECTVLPNSPVASWEYRVLEGDLGDRPEVMVTCDGDSQAKASGVEWRDGYGAVTISFDPPLEPDEYTVVNCQYLVVTPSLPMFLRRQAGATEAEMVSLSVYFDGERPPTTCWRTEWSADTDDATVISEQQEQIHRTPSDLDGLTLHHVEMALTEVTADTTVGFRWE
jgi:hypothetical protein